MDLAARTDDLFAKFATQDADGVAALCAAGCRVRRNNDPESDIETLLVELRAMFWGAGAAVPWPSSRGS